MALPVIRFLSVFFPSMQSEVWGMGARQAWQEQACYIYAWQAMFAAGTQAAVAGRHKAWLSQKGV